MRRISGRRAALRWTAVVSAVAAGALAVTGCGTQLGAAALYDNQRISSVRLADEVANLNTAYQADKHKVQISYTTAQMPRQVLSWMLRFATADRVAQRTGIAVTPAQAQAQLNAERARAAQSGDSLQEAAVLNGLPPDLLRYLGRWIAIQLKLQSKLDNGVTPRSTAGQQALLVKIDHLQCVAAKSLNIKVNPQYGAYDYRQLAVIPVSSTLAAGPVAAKASPPATNC
ncbi:MAG TPA: hypothetical protein VF843_06835 [Streptosporangiaceae bacterium]